MGCGVGCDAGWDAMAVLRVGMQGGMRGGMQGGMRGGMRSAQAQIPPLRLRSRRSGSDPAVQVQSLIPRRVHVCKSGREEVPFKYLCWLCYRMHLPRDLYLIDDAGGAEEAVED